MAHRNRNTCCRSTPRCDACPVLQLRADLAPGARGRDVQDAAARCAADLRRALPDTDVQLQLLLDAPARRPLRRTATARVE